MKKYNNFINERYFESYSSIIRDYISEKLSKETEYESYGMSIEDSIMLLDSLNLKFKENGEYNYVGIKILIKHTNNSNFTDIDYMIHSLKHLQEFLNKYNIIHRYLRNGEDLNIIIKMDNNMINLAKSLSTNNKFNL